MDNEANGREAIAFLKRRQLGRATFLPLDVIRGRSIPDSEQRQVQGMEGFVGIAVDLVQFDESYRQIASSLLGNVIIAQTLEMANRIAARVQYRYRVVTLEGDVVNPGSMSGGSQQKKTASLLSRQRQIEEMDKEIAQSESQLRSLRAKAEQMRREIGEASKELDELRALGENRRIEEQQIRASLEPLENEAKQVAQQLELYGADGQSLAEERAELEKRRISALEALERLQGEETALQGAIREAEIRRKASEMAKEELQTQLTDLKVTAAPSRRKSSRCRSRIAACGQSSTR